MWTIPRIAALSGPAVLLGTVAALSIAQRDYLKTQGWSPVRRTPTEWPSILATGPAGWLLSVAFVITGACVAVLALSLFASGPALPPTWIQRGAVLALLIAAIGMVGIAFPADPATAQAMSWHARVHNSSYPLIPLGVAASALFFALGPGDAPARTAARLLLPAMVLMFALTNVDRIAQLARYPAFLSLLVWIVVLSGAMAASEAGT